MNIKKPLLYVLTVASMYSCGSKFKHNLPIGFNEKIEGTMYKTDSITYEDKPALILMAGRSNTEMYFLDFYNDGSLDGIVKNDGEKHFLDKDPGIFDKMEWSNANATIKNYEISKKLNRVSKD